MPHVLIVDDDDNSAEMLATLVAGEGFTTAIAGSLREAKQQLLLQSPQVILLTEREDVASWARLEALTGEVALVEPRTEPREAAAGRSTRDLAV